MQEALADCEVGVPKTLTVEVTPVSKDGILVAKIGSISYSDTDKEEAPVEKAPTAKPYKPKAATVV